MDKLNVLVVDDDHDIANLVEIYLKNEGYDTIKAYNADDAIRILDSQQIHLIILDIMMPGMDGIEACRQIRSSKDIPIILLSAKSQEIDKIIGLTTGADDYITKPFSPLELVARVKSQLRRYLYLTPNGLSTHSKNIISIDEMTIDPESHNVSVCDSTISLTPIEFEILFLLAGTRGRVFSTEEIFERVWKEKYFNSNNTVMVHIRKIREKIEDNPRKPKYIKTVWGVGYKIEK